MEDVFFIHEAVSCVNSLVVKFFRNMIDPQVINMEGHKTILRKTVSERKVVGPSRQRSPQDQSRWEPLSWYRLTGTEGRRPRSLIGGPVLSMVDPV